MTPTTTAQTTAMQTMTIPETAFSLSPALPPVFIRITVVVVADCLPVVGGKVLLDVLDPELELASISVVVGIGALVLLTTGVRI